MIPVLFHIGPLTVYSYGLMLAIAVMVCAYLLSRDARPLGIAPEAVYDFVFWTVLSGIFGARLFYVLMNLDFYLRSPWEILMVQNGGLAIQGGLVLGAVVGMWQIRRMKLPPLVMWDLSAPYLALGESIGRIGCFLNGCCYGRPVAWGIYFPVHQDYLHPTQLYATAALFLIYVFLKWFQKAIPADSRPAGKIFVYYLWLESFQRFIIEFFRGDHNVTYGGLSIYQLFCIGIFSAGLILNRFIVRHPQS